MHSATRWGLGPRLREKLEGMSVFLLFPKLLLSATLTRQGNWCPGRIALQRKFVYQYAACRRDDDGRLVTETQFPILGNPVEWPKNSYPPGETLQTVRCM